jgi:hypothetical protein
LRTELFDRRVSHRDHRPGGRVWRLTSKI